MRQTQHRFHVVRVGLFFISAGWALLAASCFSWFRAAGFDGALLVWLVGFFLRGSVGLLGLFWRAGFGILLLVSAIAFVLPSNSTFTHCVFVPAWLACSSWSRLLSSFSTPTPWFGRRALTSSLSHNYTDSIHLFNMAGPDETQAFGLHGWFLASTAWSGLWVLGWCGSSGLVWFCRASGLRSWCGSVGSSCFCFTFGLSSVLPTLSFRCVGFLFQVAQYLQSA